MRIKIFGMENCCVFLNELLMLLRWRNGFSDLLGVGTDCHCRHRDFLYLLGLMAALTKELRDLVEVCDSNFSELGTLEAVDHKVGTAVQH